MAKPRRLARQAALRALYEVDLGGTFPGDAIEQAAEFAQLDDELREYLGELVWGVQREMEKLDAGLEPLLRNYEMDRLAAIDRSILRLGAFELSFVPAIPPAVTLNEAVELAKRFSTAESGRFVNGVLARYMEKTPKSQWDPGEAPFEDFASESLGDEPEDEVEEHTVDEGSPEAEEARRFGAWKIKSPDGD